jgi:NodT family efflux transporter outer membrane factor (OMF) lipoprotein
MANYPDIAAQQAALRQARDNVSAQQGVFAPQVQAVFNQERAKISGASIAPGFPGYVTNLYQANVNVSYTLDIFGGERRQLEGLQAEVANQNFVLEASYLTLTTNVAATAVQLASAREQILELGIIQRQFELGTHTRADVLQQQSNLASVRATLPGLEQNLATSEHQLAVLAGQFPHDAAPVELTLSDLKLPEELPVSLPSALVAQRPDVRQQEAQLHQASAAIGVATANVLPQVSLSASAGDEALLFASLFKPGSGVWDIASSVTAPIFQGGTLRAKRRAAIDAYDQAAARYRLTVLNAFENVADTLTALDHDAESLSAESDALSAAKASLDLIQRQYDAGAVNYVSLLTAQQLYQQSRIEFVRAVASRYTDTITLFQALGGGWWNRNDRGSLRAGLLPADR